MEKNQFFIENVIFSLDQSHLTEFNDVVIKAIPQDYELVWNLNKDPFAAIIDCLERESRAKLIIDAKVSKLYAKNTLDPYSARTLYLKASEETKSWTELTQIFDFLDERNHTKSDTLIVVGGGIIEDIGAFAAACFRRGIPWLYFPTTLLSMSDSCIGGKAGINYKNAKNQIALFSSPQKVIINANFLRTLTLREILSGLGEIHKLAITGGSSTFELFQQFMDKFEGKIDSYEFQKIISLSLEVKRNVIEYDQFEKNIRKSLNYGHTLGHIIESITEFEIPHGQAVTLGVMFANYLSMKTEILKSELFELINETAIKIIDDSSKILFKKITVNPDLNISQFLKKDKKASGEHVTMAIISEPGKTLFKSFSIDLVETQFKDFCSYFNEKF